MQLSDLVTSYLPLLNKLTPEQIKAEVEISGTELNIMHRQARRYIAATTCKVARDSDLIGVGLISFAEHRLDVFNRRIGRV